MYKIHNWFKIIFVIQLNFGRESKEKQSFGSFWQNSLHFWSTSFIRAEMFGNGLKAIAARFCIIMTFSVERFFFSAKFCNASRRGFIAFCSFLVRNCNSSLNYPAKFVRRMGNNVSIYLFSIWRRCGFLKILIFFLLQVK